MISSGLLPGQAFQQVVTQAKGRVGLRNIHIYPSPFTHESRILKEAKSLASRLGMTSISLIGVPGPSLPACERIDERTTILRLGPGKSAGAAKPFQHIFWCLNVFWFCICNRPAVVNCHSLPVLPIGVAIKIFTGAKLVYDAHELETETAGSGSTRRAVGRFVERLCIRATDLVILVSPGIERWYRAQYAIENTVTVLNAPAYQKPPRTNLLADTLSIPEGKTILLYQGLLAAARGIEQLVGAAPLLKRHGYELVFMGYGPMQSALMQQATATSDFHVHPPVEPRDLLSYTSSAHIGLCLIQDTCLSYHLSLPNKMFEYLMARLPVVASNLPEIRKVLFTANVGTCINRSDPETILKAVQDVAELGRTALQGRLDDLAKTYNWSAQEEIMTAAYKRYVLPNLTLDPRTAEKPRVLH